MNTELKTALSMCTSRKGTIKKISESKKNILVMYKGSAWESGNKIVWVSNFLGDEAKLDAEVPMPKKFTTIQLVDLKEDSPTFGNPIETADGLPVMKFDSIIEE